MALDPQRGRAGGMAGGGNFLARLSTETKHAFKTTEFWAFLAVLAGILIASAVISEEDGDDPFRADEAWRLITYLTIGYLVSRGLAKAGSREPYWADRSDLPGGKEDDDRS
jgi:hypothetical protein